MVWIIIWKMSLMLWLVRYFSWEVRQQHIDQNNSLSTGWVDLLSFIKWQEIHINEAAINVGRQRMEMPAGPWNTAKPTEHTSQTHTHTHCHTKREKNKRRVFFFFYWIPRNGLWSNSNNQNSHGDLVERKSIMAPSKGNDFFKPPSWFFRTRVEGENTHSGQIRPLFRTLWSPERVYPDITSFL